MQYCEFQIRVLLLLAYGRSDPDVPVAQFQYGMAEPAFLVAKLDLMQPLDGNFGHLVGNCMLSVSSQSVYARPEEKLCSLLMSSAEQLVDIGLAVTNVHTA